MQNDVDRWLRKMGEAVLKEVGVREGQTVLDFGCGSGYYTIPAARIVGDTGKVYGLDKNRNGLHQVRQRAKRQKLKNIQTIETSGELRIALEDKSVDVILLYDVLHSYYFSVAEGKELLAEIFRISKSGALISVYPKHMNLDDVRHEMERAHFHFTRKLFVTLLHNSALEQDYLLTFQPCQRRCNEQEALQWVTM